MLLKKNKDTKGMIYNMKKKLSMILIAAMMFMISASTVLAATFTDVSQSHWAYESIEKMAGLGIVNGTGNGKFSPADNVSGAEFVAMVTRSFYGEDVLKEAQTNGGADWSAPYLATAKELKLLDGVTADNKPMNRANMAGVIYNFLVQKGVTLPTDAELSKVKVPDIANLTAEQQKRITVVYALGYLKGVDKDGNFKGNDNMARCEAATVLTRLMDAYPTEVKVTADEIEKARANKNGSSTTTPTKPTDTNIAGEGNSENTTPTPLKDIKIATGEYSPQLSDKGLTASGQNVNNDGTVHERAADNRDWKLEQARYVEVADGVTGTLNTLYGVDGEIYAGQRHSDISFEMKIGDTITLDCTLSL